MVLLTSLFIGVPLFILFLAFVLFREKTNPLTMIYVMSALLFGLAIGSYFLVNYLYVNNIFV